MGFGSSKNEVKEYCDEKRVAVETDIISSSCGSRTYRLFSFLFSAD